MRVAKTNERDAVITIVNTGKLIVGKQTIDITDMLNKYNSKEYRKEQLSKINANKVKKEDNRCKVSILPCGSGDIPFIEDFKQNKVCILNFASSKNPGGGFMTGANAQEENLCYHSNLYFDLNEHNKFYELNRTNTYRGLYLDGIIYSSDIVFFRKNFKNIEPVLVNVITCAAPNAGVASKSGVSQNIIEATMRQRLEYIIKVAIENNNKTLVLGAFGCGVFRNDVKFVAKTIKELLFTKGYGMYFTHVVIPAMSEDDKVYKVFTEVFKEQTNENNK